VDKPALLVQCSHCHSLGHIRTSRACPLGKDSVKCYICRGSHQSEVHNQKCNWRHAVAGICDCAHFKCLNCHKTGHTCHDKRCPVRDLFRPRVSRKKRPRSNGKDRDWAAEGEPTAAPLNPAADDPFDDEDLYTLVLPTNPTSCQLRTAIHDRGIARLCGPSTYSLEDEDEFGESNPGIDYNPMEFPEAWNCPEPMDMDVITTRPTEYSPSHPQGGTTANLAQSA
jgi:hypothetical protein